MLSVRHLNKQFASRRVVDDLSFEMHWNERTALVAPSGSGKTTLINILSGLESFDNGQVTMNAAAPVTIFQEPRLFPFLTVEENIFLPFKVQAKQVTPDVRKSYQRWLDVCRLNGYTRHYPHQISGGMKQKVALIRGLLGTPRFVMMDEPFQSIDWVSKRAIIDHILENYPNTAFLFATHQVEEIPEFAQTVLYIKTLCLKQVVKLDTSVFQTFQARLELFTDHLAKISTE